VLQLSNETGKRYFCSSCNAEFIVTKGGDGSLSCSCGEALQKK